MVIFENESTKTIPIKEEEEEEEEVKEGHPEEEDEQMPPYDAETQSFIDGCIDALWSF